MSERTGMERLAQHSNERFAEFQQQVRYLADTTEDGSIRVQDEYQQSYLLALIPRLGNPDFPHTNYLYKYVLKEHSSRSLINIVNNGIRSGNAYWLNKEWPPDPAKLKKLIDPGEWTEYFDQLEDNPLERWEFVLNFDFNVQTTVPQRGALPLAGAKLLGIHQPVTMLDVGCGGNYNMTYMGLDKRHYPYEPTEVVERSEDGQSLVSSPQATHMFNALVNSGFKIAKGVGIDIQNETDTKTPRGQRLQRWKRNCYYLSEYIENFERILNIMLLGDQKPPEISFYQADVTKLKRGRLRKAHPDFAADIVLLSTVGNQLGSEGTAKTLKYTRPFVRKEKGRRKGIRGVLDFVDMQPDGTTRYRKDSWPPFSYKYYVEDWERPELGWQHFFTAENGRVPRVIFEAAAGRLALNMGFEFIYPDRFAA